MRGLDFMLAPETFAGRHFTAENPLDDYNGVRHITMGLLNERMVIVVWTPRGEARCIIRMRKANEREQARFARRLG